MGSRHLQGIDGRRLANTLRRTSLALVHIRGSYQFVRARPHGRLVAVPLYPGEILPVPIIRSILLHAALSEQTTLGLMYE